jgi:hypothetical protein
MGPVALVAVIALPFLLGVSLFEAPMHHTQVLLDLVFRWVSAG